MCYVDTLQLGTISTALPFSAVTTFGFEILVMMSVTSRSLFRSLRIVCATDLIHLNQAINVRHLAVAFSLVSSYYLLVF